MSIGLALVDDPINVRDVRREIRDGRKRIFEL